MRNREYWIAFWVSLLTFAVYLPALRNNFVIWDDNVLVYNNVNIRSLNPAFVRWALFSTATDLWQPVTWISFLIDYSLWGLKPLGFHLTNIFLHAANTFLAVALFIRLAEVAAGIAKETGAVPSLNERAILNAGAFSGLLFGLHPLHVEPVTWVSGRNDLLCIIFFQWSIMAYANFASTAERGQGQRIPGPFFLNIQYLLSLALFALALSSKPIAVTLPVVLLILDWYPFRRMSSVKGFLNACVEKLPFIMLSLATSAVTVWTQKKSGTIAPTEAVFSTSQLLVAFKALMTYLWQMIVPIGLLPYYPFPQNVSFLSVEYLFGIVLTVAITIFCILTVRKQKIFLAVWLFFIVTLLPVLGIVKMRTIYMADRYMYLPSIGPFALTGISVAWLLMKAESMRQHRRELKLSVVAVAILLSVVMSYLTIKQISIWKDTITLWSYFIEKSPRSVPTAYTNRGLAFREIGRLDLALADYDMAVAVDRNFTEAYMGRAMVFKELGQNYRALEDDTKAIALTPKSAEAYTNRGIVLGETGQFDLAIEDFSTAISLHPEYVDAYVGRGLVFERAGQVKRSLDDFDEAIKLNPFSVDAYLNRGVAFEHMGDFDRALEDYGKAIVLKPVDSLAYLNRGMAFSKMGRVDEALKDYQRACDLGSREGCEALRIKKRS